MFQRSIQAKLSLALSVVILSAALVVGIGFANRNTQLIEERAAREQGDRLQEINRLLTVTHYIMSQRVETAMRYLQQTGAAMGEPNLGEQVPLKDQRVPDLRFGDVSQVAAAMNQMSATVGATLSIISVRFDVGALYPAGG